MSTLKLCIHGQVKEFPVNEEFDIESLKRFCELENIRKDSNTIYALVNHFTRPFSELLNALNEPIVEWTAGRSQMIINYFYFFISFITEMISLSCFINWVFNSNILFLLWKIYIISVIAYLLRIRSSIFLLYTLFFYFIYIYSRRWWTCSWECICYCFRFYSFL